MTKILVVEDESALARALVITLRARHYDVVAVGTGTAALDHLMSSPVDAVILDLGLPDIDGIDVITAVRAWSRVPILVLSARVGSVSKVDALDAGADDYVTKPFGMDELLARVRAAVRRAEPTLDAPPVVETAHFSVDLVAKRVQRSGHDVRLTPTEWQLLEVLVRHPGQLISQTDLLHRVWGPQYERETNYLRVYMAQLRRKLEPLPATPRYLITEPGLGYRFDP